MLLVLKARSFDEAHALPSVVGFAVALRCIWDFGWTGRGTPAPFVPPQRLVVVGFYRYVRNPMYVGFAAGWIGLWIVFAHADPLPLSPSPRSRSACTCSWFSMRNRPCARNLELTTKSIAPT